MFGLACRSAPTQLISLNAINATQSVQNATNKQVRYIANTVLTPVLLGVFSAPTAIFSNWRLEHRAIPEYTSVASAAGREPLEALGRKIGRKRT